MGCVALVSRTCDAGAGCTPSCVWMQRSGCVSSEAGSAGDWRVAMAGPRQNSYRFTACVVRARLLKRYQQKYQQAYPRRLDQSNAVARAGRCGAAGGKNIWRFGDNQSFPPVSLMRQGSDYLQVCLQNTHFLGDNIGDSRSSVQRIPWLFRRPPAVWSDSRKEIPPPHPPRPRLTLRGPARALLRGGCKRWRGALNGQSGISGPASLLWPTKFL